MMRKRRKAWGEEFWFCSYMPPFFFDFFFLAFVGLFTRLHIHNGVCLRILLFSRRHDISWQKFPIRSSSLCNLQTSDRFLFLLSHLVSARLTRSNSLKFPVFVAVCKKLVTSADWFQRCLLSRHVTKHIASLQDSILVTFV